MRNPVRYALLTVALGILAGCGGGSSGMPGGGPTPPPPTPGPIQAIRISSDPFVNASSQHATEVEPDIVASGATLVVALQQGRFPAAGSSDVGFATSQNGGLTWTAGSLPGTTTNSTPAGPYDSVSDPSVAFDAKHIVWLMSSLPILFSNAPTPAVLVNRSIDGGLTWGNPVSIAPGQVSNDKDWITCDSNAGSPHYGNCYVEWDDPSANDLIHMSTSSDGGVTWSAPANTADNATGIGGQPLVQPNGTVIVPINDAFQANMLSFRSTDGGATWSSTVSFGIANHLVGGGMRTSPLPSAAMDASGKVYLAWQDCSFRVGCASNDIVIRTTMDGVSWSPLARVPIDATTSTVDHFIPGIGIDPTTSGAGAHIGLTYYYFPDAGCSTACELFVGFVGSLDGGATWTAPQTIAGPMSLSWLAQTTQGPMVGDYIATAFSGGQPIGVFAIANPKGVFFDEGMYVPKPGFLTLHSAAMRASLGERPVRGAHSDHGPRQGLPIRIR
ncbi:MAG TPA: sialidase family protein [Candidatus Eremiobacteraceae bacterium]|nr:sialidase family protein [Candidatus Eremiobacteraceae bacterium]